MPIYQRTKHTIRHLAIHLEPPLDQHFALARNLSERTTRGMAQEAIREYLARHYPEIVSQAVSREEVEGMARSG